MDPYAQERIESLLRQRIERSMTQGSLSIRRGIHEITLVHLCCDRRSGARSSSRWMRHIRGGRCAAECRCGTGWSMSAGLLARSCRAGLLDTTGPAGSVWRVPASLSPWAARRLVLGGLCWLSLRQKHCAGTFEMTLGVAVMTARRISIALATEEGARPGKIHMEQPRDAYQRRPGVKMPITVPRLI